MKQVLVLLLAAALVPHALRAQSAASARIEGVVTDSVYGKPAVGATVLLTRIAPEPSELRTEVTDDKGRFRFDSLVAGRYSIAYATEYLDSLNVAMPPREVALAAGQAARVNFATPSGATLRSAACPGVALPRGQGAVVGKVTDADTDQPLTTARVAVSWNELSVDKTTLHPISTPRGGVVPVDAAGRYHLCGVPTATYLMLQVQDSGRAGSVLTVTVGDEGGVLVRDLSLSAASARSIAALDSTAAAAAATGTVTQPLLSGTATLNGVVLGPGGQPLPGAQVRVRDAAGAARSDSAGRFTLTNLPAGSQVLETRRVGYLLSRVPVELRGGRVVRATVALTRIVSLDSIRIVARRSRYTEFEQRRQSAGGFGKFLDQAEIEKRNAFETSDLLSMMPGFKVMGVGFDAKVISSRGFNFDGRPCETNVVINGIQHQDINLVDPSNVGAVEAYPSRAGSPPQYDADCGTILIWTKR